MSAKKKYIRKRRCVEISILLGDLEDVAGSILLLAEDLTPDSQPRLMVTESCEFVDLELEYGVLETDTQQASRLKREEKTKERKALARERVKAKALKQYEKLKTELGL